MRDVWIFDIDGTLSDSSHRVHLLASRPRQWKAFFDRQSDDLPHEGTCAIARNLHAAGQKILFLSGRNESGRKTTLSWLKQHVLPVLPESQISELLHLREDGDHTQDDILKTGWIRNLQEEHPEMRILGIFEDRPRIVAALRQLGFLVFDPGTWMHEEEIQQETQEQQKQQMEEQS